ncbi:MAG: LysM peptidoglycan-binding domain-containing protein [bacterium]|nr:LysM peptidoglycan-binding domain-containing protein [bacterium]
MRSLRLLIILVGVLGAAIAVIGQDSRTHTVQPGDNLYRIAQLYSTSVSALAEANDITLTWRIYTGQELRIPSADLNTLNDIAAETLAEAPSALSETSAGETQTAYHTVTWGDSLGSIARRYEMTLDQLARLNNISNPNLIYVGQQLIVSGATPSNTTAAPGETAAISPESIIETSAPAPLIANYSVVIPPVLETSSATTTTETVSHIVRTGESLSGIARTYNVSLLAITQANDIYNPDTIYVGQELAIPTVTTATFVDAGISTVPAAPAPSRTVGRELIVDISDQRAYAYENGVLVRNVLVSTGLPATPTVRGEFTVQRKYVAQTMTGPGYYLPDVPYILYFYAGYAFHGTYWHENFGQPMSHGCVNMPTPEAEWLYHWADVGTPVRVQA